MATHTHQTGDGDGGVLIRVTSDEVRSRIDVQGIGDWKYVVEKFFFYARTPKIAHRRLTHEAQGYRDSGEPRLEAIADAFLELANDVFPGHQPRPEADVPPPKIEFLRNGSPWEGPQ